MKTIYKYPLELVGLQDIFLPEEAEILSIQYQGEQLQLWALVNPNNIVIQRRILCLGTGHKSIEEPGIYISSVQQPPFIWHFFDKGVV